MPGANYMGGKRNAAKAKVKDTKGRLEKSFFGQRRLCAASQAMKRNNIPLEEGLGCANISLGHAKRKIPQNDDLLTSSFIPNPIDVSTATPRSPRRTKRRLEAHSSSSDVGGSKVLDALDVSEPMFLRQVLNRILTMPDLAGISTIDQRHFRTKPTVGEVREPELTSIGEITGWKEGYPTSIVFRGFKNSSAKRPTTTDTYPVEEPSVYGTLFEQDDPWDTIGQILGLPNTNPSRRPREVIDEFNEHWSEASFETSSALVEMEERPEITQLSETDVENIGQFLGLPNTKPSRSPEEVIDEFNEIDWNEASFETSSALVEMEERPEITQLYETGDVEDIGQILGLPNTKPSKSLGEVIDEFNEIDWSEASFETGSAVVEIEERQLSETGDIDDEQLFIDDEYESALAIPELEELDGLFIGPSLFELEDEL